MTEALSENEELAISVVIPAFKAQSTIERTIDSVLDQLGVLTEIIVVEDGVFDNTSELVELYGESVTLISYPDNRGACQARNIGLGNAKYDFVMFLDADDYLKPDYLEGLGRKLQKSNADVCFGKIIKKWDNGLEKEFKPPKHESNIEVLIRWLCGRSGPSPCGILWKKDAVIRIGKWNERLSKNQDGELVIRAMLEGLSVCSSYKSEAIYTQHEGDNRVSQRSDESAFLSLLSVDSYVKECTSKEAVYWALNYYRADMAYRALSFCSEPFFEKFNELWVRRVPRIGFIRLHGFRIFTKHLLYFFLGIKGLYYVRKRLKF